jgi:phosphoglycerol transferase MdoB-like AlkP superfamily enzyme
MLVTPIFTFLRHFLTWLLFFQVARFIFFVWNIDEIQGLPPADVLALPLRSLYLDIAMSSYFMLPTWLFYSFAWLTEKSGWLRIERVFTGVLVVLVSIFAIGELPIYDEWNSKLSYKAVVMLSDPSEVARTATNGQLFWGVLAIAALSRVGVWLFQKIAGTKGMQPKRRPLWASLAFTLLTPGLLIIGMRGGLQQIPIQVSDAYYSQHQALNAASTNTVFHLMSSFVHGRHLEKPYQFMPDEEARTVFSNLMKPERDSTQRLFATPRPNLVLVILESFSADLIASLGGYEGITPNLDRLAKEGFLFSDCHASGLRSDQGMASIFSGFPAQPLVSIIRMPNKVQRLPCFVPALESAGYATSFMFGGQLSYGNIRSYLYFNGFDRIVEGDDFDDRIPRCKLGVADEYLFERQLAELSKEKQPFFAAMFNLSSHSPYDMPMEEVITWGDKEKPYLNSVYYADRCLGQFMEQAKNTDWYKNTVFIFIADHGHTSPRGWSHVQPEFRKIPLLFYGDALKPEFQGKTDTLPASQTDLAATLLAQLALPIGDFKYAQNLFNPSGKRSAFYTFDEGFGLVKPGGKQLCWHVRDNRTEFVKPENDSVLLQQNLREGKAILQVVMRDYFDF